MPWLNGILTATAWKHFFSTGNAALSLTRVGVKQASFSPLQSTKPRVGAAMLVRRAGKLVWPGRFTSIC